jgi:hypothetical protein
MINENLLVFFLRFYFFGGRDRPDAPTQMRPTSLKKRLGGSRPPSSTSLILPNKMLMHVVIGFLSNQFKNLFIENCDICFSV